MVCECVSPPPEFNIPPPPDPSLIWHLLSDEPLTDELAQIQQCDINQKTTTSHSEISSVFSDFPDYLFYALLVSGAIISAALTVIIIYIRIRRFNRKEQRKMKRKSDFSAGDIVLNSTDWPYTTTTFQNSNSVINSDLLYGSNENNFLSHKAVRVTPNSFRSFSYHSNKLSVNSMQKSPLQSTTVYRIRGSSDGYCTIGRSYEEISGNGAFNAIPSGNPIIYASRRELFYGIPSIRRPPPKCRPPPPPPPCDDSPLSLDSSGNSTEKERDIIHNVSSLKHLTDDEKSRNSGNSGDNGHESGYGTAANRSWNSPMIMHQQKRYPLSESEDTFRCQKPLTVYAHHHSNAHPMTYV